MFVRRFLPDLFVRFMPQKISELLAVEETRMGVISNNEASNVLLTAFRKTEEALDFPYEVFCFLHALVEDHYIHFGSGEL